MSRSVMLLLVFASCFLVGCGGSVKELGPVDASQAQSKSPEEMQQIFQNAMKGMPADAKAQQEKMMKGKAPPGVKPITSGTAAPGAEANK